MSIRREHVSSFRSAHLPLRHVLSVKPPLLRCCPASSIGATFNDPNWESEACPICLDPLGEDSSVFNSDISRWNVNNVVFADKMFKGSLDFNRDLCSWTFRQSAIVTDMFLGAETFNADPSTRPPKVGTNGGGGVSCDS